MEVIDIHLSLNILDDEDESGNRVKVNNVISTYDYEETFFKAEDYAILMKSYIKKLKKHWKKEDKDRLKKIKT